MLLFELVLESHLQLYRKVELVVRVKRGFLAGEAVEERQLLHLTLKTFSSAQRVLQQDKDPIGYNTALNLVIVLFEFGNTIMKYYDTRDS